MNIFTTDQFLETAGELYFPHRKRRIEVCRLEGRRLRLLILDGRDVASTMNFYDFPQPLLDAKGPVDRDIPWLPRTVVHTTAIAERKPEQPGQQPSPYIDWKKHATWADFEGEWKTRAISKSNDSPRQRRRLEKEVGPLKFTFDDPSPEVFDACIAWKSGQYRATGLTDMFQNPLNVALFRRLKEKKVLAVSSLFAGDTLLAAHLGGFHDGRFSWWIPSYDSQFHKYSPGRLLLEDILKASFERGDLEFDFLIGDEAYKFQYATHNRVIGPVGTPPLRHLIQTKARSKAKAWLEKNPKALALAKDVRQRIMKLTSSAAS
jgi:CelD/BcsL family acetyltransferase involved in cellulose biosynthesis